MAVLELLDSRRLTGPNLQAAAPGAVIDVKIEGADVADVLARWRAHARDLLDAVGWQDEQTAHRVFPGGASLLLTAPIDALYAATEVNEAAWAQVAAEFGGPPPPDAPAAGLRETIAAERNPALLRLRDAARARGVTFLWDDDEVSVGMGTGSRTWPAADPPAPDHVPWDAVHDVPVALVSGSNGKTTTVRLLSAMAVSGGMVPGSSNTDGLYVGDECLDAGDWSGPGGARAVLRNRSVQVAVLETARGGLLRRGLMVERADAALLTNVAADHLGEFGVVDIEGIAAVKMLIAHAVRRRGLFVANADDPVVVRHATAADVHQRVWFSPEPPPDAAHACFVQEGLFAYRRGDATETFGAVADAPLTFRGAARYNVSNILGAIPVGRALGFSPAAMREALAQFAREPENNPGRGQLFELGGVRVFVDFAHNPHGMKAVAEALGAMPARRRLVVLGQAGDRSDEDVRELVRRAAVLDPDRVIIKEMRAYLRGRPEGEVVRIIADELGRLGVTPDRIARADDELAALAQALAWAEEGDLVVLPVHENRAGVVQRVRDLERSGWRPGAAVG